MYEEDIEMAMEFNFDLVDRLTPDKVIEDKLKELVEVTKGYVEGKIEPYSGRIFSYDYTKGTGLANLNLYQNSEETVHVDIQDKLGEQNNEEKKFEVYLKVKGIENYKYRMMFVEYGTVSYPATVVLNADIAAEYGSGRRNTIVKLNSMLEIQELLNKIFESGMMMELIQNLINEAIRQENMVEG